VDGKTAAPPPIGRGGALQTRDLRHALNWIEAAKPVNGATPGLGPTSGVGPAGRPAAAEQPLQDVGESEILELL